MSRNSILFTGGKGVSIVEGQQFPTCRSAAACGFSKVVSVTVSSSYNPKLELCRCKNLRTNHRSSPNICFGVKVVGFSRMASEDGRFFKLSDTTVLKIQKGDITKWIVNGSSDAVVNPANERMLGGGGADGAIHRAAGPELVEACYKVPEVRPDVRCPTGEARITPGFKLTASHVIHTVGPIYGSDKDPKASLTSAYKNCLIVAKENNIKYIAFTAISCGVHGYPLEEAATVAISTVKEFADDIKEVHFVLFSDQIYDTWLKKAEELLQA